MHRVLPELSSCNGTGQTIGQRTSSGIYFLRVQSGRDVVTRKLVQIK